MRREISGQAKLGDDEWLGFSNGQEKEMWVVFFIIYPNIIQKYTLKEFLLGYRHREYLIKLGINGAGNKDLEKIT